MKSQVKEGPDRGWSWVIVFATFMISLILAGIYRTSGILLVAFIKEFGVSREDASWPLVLCFALVDLTGIVVGPLGQRFGLRAITIVGSLISALGVSLCYFADSLKFITVCFGIIFGCGFGLAYTLMPVIINEYFLNHRATANGISHSGACFGSVILPPLYEHLMSTYHFNGFLLLIGGVILQLVVAGALMRPAPWLENDKTDESLTHCDKIVDIDKISQNNSSEYFEAGKIKELTITGNITEENQFGDRRKRSLSLPSNDFSEESGIYLECHLKQMTENKSLNALESLSYLKISEREQEEDTHTVSNLQEVSVKKNQTGTSADSAVAETEKLLDGYQEEAPRLNHPVGSVSYAKISERKLEDDTHIVSDLQDVFLKKNETVTPAGSAAAEIEKLLDGYQEESSEMVMEAVPVSKAECNGNNSVSILRSFKMVLSSPMFYIIGYTTTLFYFVEEMFFVINVDYYLDQNIKDTDIKYIIFAFSVCDLFGRLCFGWITDRKFLRRSHFLMICMAIIALIFFLFPFANSYGTIMLLNCIYGSLLGCTTIILNVLLVDYLDMDVQAVAFGFLAFLNGLLGMACSSLIGYFRDYLGSYSDIFYIIGGLSLFTSFIWLLEKRFMKSSIIPTSMQSS